MALDPLELGVIALMVIGVFIWGPDKIPQIAKQVSSARKQLEGYTKQLQGVTKEIQTSMSTGNIDNLGNVLSSLGTNLGNPAAPAAPPGSLAAMEAAKAAGTAPAATIQTGRVYFPKPTSLSADELLLDMARKFGIDTQGKTRDELQVEILQRSSAPADAPASKSVPAPEPVPIQGADLV